MVEVEQVSDLQRLLLMPTKISTHWRTRSFSSCVVKKEATIVPILCPFSGSCFVVLLWQKWSACCMRGSISKVWEGDKWQIIQHKVLSLLKSSNWAFILGPLSEDIDTAKCVLVQASCHIALIQSLQGVHQLHIRPDSFSEPGEVTAAQQTLHYRPDVDKKWKSSPLKEVHNQDSTIGVCQLTDQTSNGTLVWTSEIHMDVVALQTSI